MYVEAISAMRSIKTQTKKPEEPKKTECIDDSMQTVPEKKPVLKNQAMQAIEEPPPKPVLMD